MTIQSSASFDFVAETKGHCFLCSSKTSSWNNSHPDPTSLESPSIHSLHSLSRYLKMDMKKVFNVEGPLPPHLVVRVEKSKLKAELCQECASLTKSFSRQLRQLEKIQMEMTSGLSRIHQKLERAAKGSGERQMNNWSDPDFKDEWVAKLEITEALRMEAIQKCSYKLGSAIPLAKLERLTDKQVTAEKLRIKFNFLKADSPTTTLQESESYRDEDIGSPLLAPLSEEERHDYYADEQNDSISSPVVDEEKWVTGMEALKQEVIGAAQHLAEPNYSDSKMREEHVSEPNRQTRRNREANRNALTKTRGIESAATGKKVDKLSQAIPPPIKVSENDGIGMEKPEISLNPETGRYKCPNCSKEFGAKNGCQAHYDSAHLKVMFKCGVCEKTFTIKQRYETHYLSIHMGVKFKCGECNKTFTTKGYLIQHQNNVHLGREYKCKYCDEKFSLPQYKYAHMKKKCPGRNLSGPID